MLVEFKENLKITWDDEDGNLEKILNRAKNYLESDIAGVKLNFENDNSNKELLFDCGRYIYNNAFEYFEENFKSQLLRLQLKSAVIENEKTG